MKKALSLLLVITFSLSLFLAGCTGNTNKPAQTPPTNEENGANGGTESKDPIIIGALTSLSGALQDYGKQNKQGFMLGLEYATNGTMEVAGRPIEVIWEDTTNVPDVARERALKLLDKDKVDILMGCASSSDAAAILDLAKEFKTIYVIEPAAADFLTGDSWNKYIFRTGRNSAQDAAAMADVIINSKAGARVATLAPDSAFGRSMVDPIVNELIERGGELVHQEFPPAETTDFSPYIMRIREAKPDYLYVIWAGANNPWSQLMEFKLESYGIKVTTGAPEIAALKSMTPMIGMQGFSVYHHTLPQNNPANEWLIKEMKARYDEVPDLFTPGGMSAAIAIVTALEKTGGNTDSEVLIETMEDMEYESPTGKRYFRKEDHQSIQPLYEIILREVEGVDYPVPEFVREIPAEDIAPPITAPGR
ncbi:substrate-binding domain-containing protein [Proteiniborus sp. MB09-C3]|uniref:substrate-binding domain-containing protein n=1 Tax=Proteiniborus sp. MB09-C3 TaxID=3050072 RepID=UPI002555DCF6|nr:substrate-binding domain-containing protein [Proteiniborus sp. MB09-C3]WIV13100.1 substrate-binding domain-containing protein [Proteiniborus sp. MB09-C3]